VNASLTEDAPTSYTLESAILLYRGADKSNLAMRYDVRADAEGVVRLADGRFATGSLVKELLAMLDRAPLSYVPPSVIATARDAVAWYEPAAMQTMYFDADRDRAVTAFDGKVIPQPPLVFIASKRSLRVFALRTDTRPDLTTPLCEAPYWNTYEDGGICLGSMKIPAAVDPSATAQWTRNFFRSSFTHLTTGKRWAHRGTYAELLADAVKLGHFDPAWLKPARGTTIKSAICGD
jgi:PRTRC genetic system protein B